MTDQWEQILRVIIEIVVPWILLDLELLLSSMLDIRLVHVLCKSLVSLPHECYEWIQPCLLIEVLLAWLHGEDGDHTAKTLRGLLAIEVDYLVANALNV